MSDVRAHRHCASFAMHISAASDGDKPDGDERMLGTISPASRNLHVELHGCEKEIEEEDYSRLLSYGVQT